jgi:putative ABC transport system permease protein
VGKVSWSQLRYRTARSVALLLGMLLATTAFTVLTAASRTAQLRTVGTVSAHFIPSYDILVRPRGARTGLETQTDTVQPNFLSGIYGGISMAQYRQIQQIPGVQVAAPVAMVGYALLHSFDLIQVPAADYARPGRQLYRYTTTWVSAGGATRITQPASYLYVTPNRLGFNNATGADREMLPGGSTQTVCPQLGRVTSPFGAAAQSGALCWSKIDKLAGGPYPGQKPDQRAFSYLVWSFPMLMAAVDPVAEAKLDGLNHALVSGRYLKENAGDGITLGDSLSHDPTFPILAAASSGIGEYADTQVQRLAAPTAPPVITVPWMVREAAAAGPAVLTNRTSAQQAYLQLLASMNLKGQKVYPAINQFWTVGPTSYQRATDGNPTPVLVSNPTSVWRSAIEPGGIVAPPMANADNQYRQLQIHAPTSTQFFSRTFPAPVPSLVGVFDPAKIQSFDPLSQVPLGPYQPVAAAPADTAGRKALGGSDLLPNQNLGGYVTQPVQLITTLSALPALENSSFFSGNLHAADPISVIRVRVAGVTGPNAVSLERIRQVAQQIAVGTHLEVDIVAGSSPSPTTIDLPAGKFGQPALALTEGWVKKGVALTILRAVDKNSVVLFTLILIVCILFVANSATAAIRGRRRELGVLACLGWTRPRMFTAVLGELAAIGLTAGLAGAAAALPLSAALGLHASLGRAALAVPVAIAVAVTAGAIPAWLAARADPIASVRPPVLAVRRGHHPGSITGLAVVNVLRTPGRALIGALSLAVGVTALTLLAAVTFAFRGVVVGSLLGNAVAVQVRGVDYIAVTATIALGVLAVADVVYLNITERAAELAAIRTFGWRESALSRLVITEGAVIGITGSAAGAAAGLAAAAQFTGHLPDRLYLIAAAAIAAGAVTTAVAALLPAQMLRRLPAAQLLAEE